MPRLMLSCRRHSWLSASGRAWRVLDETLSITTWKLPAIPSRNIMMTTWPKRERRTWRRSPYRSRSGNLYVWGVFSKLSACDHFYSLWARDLRLFFITSHSRVPSLLNRHKENSIVYLKNLIIHFSLSVYWQVNCFFFSDQLSLNDTFFNFVQLLLLLKLTIF